MKILQTTLEFAKEFVALKRITQVVVVLILGYAAFAMGTCSTQTKFDEFKIEYEQVLQDRARITEQANALKTEAVLLAQSAEKLQDTIKTLKVTISVRSAQRMALQAEYGELRNALQVTTDTTVLLVTQQQMIGNLETQLANADSVNADNQLIITSTEKQVEFYRRAYELSDVRGDSLQRVLNSLPKPPKDPNKWMLGLPKPTRTQVAIVSVAVGAYGGYKLREALNKQR